MTQIILTEETSITNALDTLWVEAIKTELQKTVEFSKSLKITNIDDKKQFQLIKDTKNGYVKTRNSLERAFKSKRDFYNKASADNLVAQREAVWVITEEENRLAEIVSIANLKKLREDNVSKLKDRKEALSKCECTLSDEQLLDMKEKDFEDFLTDKRIEFANKKEAELKEREAKIAREKELEEAKKQAKLEAEQEAQKKADLEKQRVEQEKIQASIDKTKEIERVAQEKQKEIDRLNKEKEDELQAKLEAENKFKQDQIELEKNKKYNEYKSSIDFDISEKVNGKEIFYKKVWEFII